MSHSRQVAWRWTMVMIVVAASGLALQAGLSVAAHALDEPFVPSMVATGSSFVYRFDPVSHTFVTVSLPIDSVPMHAVVTGTAPTHVWVTEYGRNQIGHLVFTSTNSFVWTEYPVTSTSNSRPYRMAIAGNSVWFTERGANRIGRLNTTTGQLDEFHDNGLSPNGNLADIEVAPDGRVWIAAPGSKRLVQLVVTNTQAYAFHEYTDTLRPAIQIAPYDLVVENNEAIWLAIPDGASHSVARFSPSNKAFDYAIDLTGATQDARRIAVTASGVWYTNLSGNSLDQAEIGTTPLINHRVAISAPIALAAAAPNTFWLTRQIRPAVISRAIYTSTPAASSVVTYDLPVKDLTLTSIAVATDGSVWITAYQPTLIFLPLVKKS